jgi:hypothetical protein
MANLTINPNVLGAMPNQFFSSFWNNRNEILCVINNEAIDDNEKKNSISSFLPQVSEIFDLYIYRNLFNPRIFEFKVEEFDSFAANLNDLVKSVEKIRVICYENNRTRSSYIDTFERVILPTIDYSAESRNNPQFEDTIVTGLQYR